jgi:transposase
MHRLDTVDLTLTDERWERIAALLLPRTPKIGRPSNEHRPILAGILWVIQTGAAWRDVPEQCGPWETIHSRYQRWRSAGIWQQIFQAFTQEAAPHAS